MRSRDWQLALGGVLAALVFAFFGGFRDTVVNWTRADYSHGFLMPGFVGYLLWKRRDRLPGVLPWPMPGGVAFYAVAAAIYFVASLNIGKEFLRGTAILVALAGIAWMFFGGRRGLTWALPGLLFLVLGLQLPYQVEGELSLKLRTIAAQTAVFVLQTIGFPTYAVGYEITIGPTKLQVAETCSGLSMLLTFVALVTAIVLLCPPSRRNGDRFAILLAAAPIAVACNVGRIVVTGLVYRAGWKELGDGFVHDFAGWAMMPFALGMVWLLFKLIDWLLLPGDTATTEEFAKVTMAKTVAKMRKSDDDRAAWRAAVGLPSSDQGPPP